MIKSLVLYFISVCIYVFISNVFFLNFPIMFIMFVYVFCYAAFGLLGFLLLFTWYFVCSFKQSKYKNK